MTTPVESEAGNAPRDRGRPVLAVQQLEVVYNHVQLAVQGVSIAVHEHEIVAVLGTNGAGKTTTLRAMSGFLPGDDAEITDGQVILDAKVVTGKPPHTLARRGMVLVPERDKVFMTLTVAENLDAVPTIGSKSDRAEKLALIRDLFPVLGDRANMQAGYLSGGERQMLAIAKALLLNPQVLLIDELSFGLAPQMVQRLMATLVQTIERFGLSVLLVEQNAAAALGIADYAYVLENGKVVLDGSAADLLAHEDVQEFYLGMGADQGYTDLKQYKRKRRWW